MRSAGHWEARESRAHAEGGNSKFQCCEVPISVDLLLSRSKNQVHEGAERCNARSQDEGRREATCTVDEPPGHEHADNSGKRRKGIADPIDHLGMAWRD